EVIRRLFSKTGNPVQRGFRLLLATFDSFQSGLIAFADAATGEFERLKEFGIKAKTQGDDVTFSWTKNGKEMTKTVKKSSNEIRAFLLETMGDRFAGAMDKQSRTWNGMMSNLGDVWSSFQ
ncbi:hypothetical protein P8631_14065, partial [Guyparkeria sp. 1SP6A2]|nr:hypothetical protein [Guyparkeria sp. 1SP6A2]